MSEGASLIAVPAEPADHIRRLPRGRHVAALIKELALAVETYRKASHSGELAATRRARAITKVLHQRAQARNTRR